MQFSLTPAEDIENTKISSSSAILYTPKRTGSTDSGSISFPLEEAQNYEHEPCSLTVTRNGVDNKNGISHIPFISEHSLSNTNQLSHLPSISEQALGKTNERSHRLSYSRTPLQSQEGLNTHNVLQTSPSPTKDISMSSLKTNSLNSGSGKGGFDSSNSRRKSTSCLTNRQPVYINVQQHSHVSPSKSLRVDPAWYHSASSLETRQALPPDYQNCRDFFIKSNSSNKSGMSSPINGHSASTSDIASTDV